jgi:hypothetical protein
VKVFFQPVMIATARASYAQTKAPKQVVLWVHAALQQHPLTNGASHAKRPQGAVSAEGTVYSVLAAARLGEVW